MTQSLFVFDPVEPPKKPARVIVPNASVDARDRARLLDKCAVILARLEIGKATNRELNTLCFSYRQRISELRQAGYRIDCERLGDGLASYELVRA